MHKASPLALDAEGFIAVHPTLESVSHAGVFAAGDVAAVLAYPRPKAGVFAVRQGLPLAHNLRLALLSEPLQPYTPQRSFLGLLLEWLSECAEAALAFAFSPEQVAEAEATAGTGEAGAWGAAAASSSTASPACTPAPTAGTCRPAARRGPRAAACRCWGRR